MDHRPTFSSYRYINTAMIYDVMVLYNIILYYYSNCRSRAVCTQHRKQTKPKYVNMLRRHTDSPIHQRGYVRLGNIIIDLSGMNPSLPPPIV